jgi:hypothetical protein
MSDAYRNAGCEPPLEELLADPIMKLLLARDGIDPADLRCYLRALRARLQAARGHAREPAAAA